VRSVPFGSVASQSIAHPSGTLTPRTGTPPVVVLGAGPYGLAIAAHLSARGIHARAFGDPMSSWRDQMPRGMYLKSTPSASNIGAPAPGSGLADFCRDTGREPLVGHHPIPLDVFVAYGVWFQQRQVPHLERHQVTGVERHASGFGVTLDSGEELEARSVIVASGHGRYAYVPPELARIAPEGPSVEGPLSHSGQHHDLSRFAGRDVAVVGAGQSALETAALLHELGAHARVLVRGPVARFGGPPADIDRQAGTPLKPESPLGPGWSHVAFAKLPSLFRRLPLPARLWFVERILGPSGAWWLRERVVGELPVDCGEQIRSAAIDGGRVRLEITGAGGPHALTVDHVVAATGYHVDVDSLEFLSPELRSRIARSSRSPRLGPSFESSVPGLYFTGLAAAATFGPLMRFVCGTTFAARRIASSLAR
jgi:Pyridine nucleotide-disulphide oxidoreductase